MSTHSKIAVLVFASLGSISAAHAGEGNKASDEAGAETKNAARKPLEEVIVTASPLAHDDSFLATIVGSVDRSQILQNGGATLADALANVPGVTGTSFAAGASRPVIRGLGANRVLVLEDGIDSFDVSDVGPDHGVPIDPLSAQKIEVVRGAATLRYGSQAIGGVVNAINDRIPRQIPDKPFNAELTGSYGSNADTRQGSALLDAGMGQFALHADGFDRHTDNYGIPGGTQPNSFFDGNGYALGGSYFFGPDRVGADVVRYDARYGIPSDTTYIDMHQTKEMLSSSFEFHQGSLQTVTVEGGAGDYEHQEIDPESGEAAATFKDNAWDARVESVFGTVGPFSGAALGVQSQHRDFSALGEGADYLRPTTTRTDAAFLFAEAPLTDRLRLQTGARVEHVEVQGTPASDEPVSRTFTPVSGSFGLVFDAARHTRLGVTLTSAARAPAQTELFARGPHDGPGTFETGDPALSEERANSLEGTLRVNLGNVSVESALWAAKFDHYIFGDLTGRTCDDEGVCVTGSTEELRELNYTQVDATFRGAETQATVSLFESSKGTLQANFLADYVRATIDQGGNVPRIPPYHVGVGLHWSGKLDGGFMLRYSGRQSDTAIGETPTPGFASLDAHLDWRPLRSHPGFVLALVGHNLTNSVQRNAVALNKDDVILPGRDIRLLVRAAF